MAKVIFKPGQPVQELRGTYAGAIFRTLSSGQTIVHFKPADEHLTREQRIIEQCTDTIQIRMHDLQEAVDQRQAIRRRIRRFYEHYHRITNDDDILVRHILTAYYNSRRKLPSRAKTATFIRVLTDF